jgi:hypothetical protein
MINLNFLKGYFGDPRTLIGYAGTGSFFWAEHFQAISGMVLGAAMIVLSILMQWQKIRSLRQDERHKEERFQQEMRQNEIEFQSKINQNGKS